MSATYKTVYTATIVSYGHAGGQTKLNGMFVHSVLSRTSEPIRCVVDAAGGKQGRTHRYSSHVRVVKGSDKRRLSKYLGRGGNAKAAQKRQKI